LKYRPDIDGLRAVAVIPVVLFHAGTPGFGGGYVGVDVFFVISGYLITSLIVSQQQAGKFSISWFYERRIRRIFPALFVVMLFCIIAGWAVVAPGEYKSLGGSVFATSVFLSNVLFWMRSGYFETSAEQQPLLHTWSLAVEEQFYLLFPMLMILLARKEEMIFRVIGLFAFVSFILSAILVFYYPVSTFYLSPFRAWELLLGSLLAINRPKLEVGHPLRNLCSAAGLVMILVPVIFYSKETIFPGISAAIPAIGAAMFVYAGQNSSCSINKMISSKPIVLVGQVSYSLYLWHFVFFTFGSYLSIGKLTTLQILLLIALSAVTAVLSWRFVEQPVRQARLALFKGRLLFATAGFAVASFAIAGLAIRSMNGFENRLTTQQRQLVVMEMTNDPCRPTTVALVESHEFCKLGSKEGLKPSFMVWGDSHGIALRPAFIEIARRNGSVGLLASTGGCPPLIDVVRMEPTYRGCEKINQEIFSFIRSSPSIIDVILVARWAYFVEGGMYKDEPTDRYRTKHVLLANTSTSPQRSTRQVMATALDQTVGKLLTAGKRVWIVGPVPEIGVDVPKALYLRTLGIGTGIQIEPPREEFERRQFNAIQMIKTIAGKYQIAVVWPDQALCTNKSCAVAVEGRSLYQDDNHLSEFGALLIEPIIEKIDIK
jgi:peptidoglycan/LPS O-acetylase OafA/YrhL